MVQLSSLFLTLAILLFSNPDSLAPPALTNRPASLILGSSTMGTPIQATRFGRGPKALVLSHGIHGAFEANTVELGEFFRLFFSLYPPPSQLSVYIIHNLNPDSFELSKNQWKGERVLSRFNARMVDLNRNWESQSWKPNVSFADSSYRGIGGPRPFSEPETRAFRDFLLALQSQHPELLVVNYHSYRFLEEKPGIVQPAYSPGHVPVPQALEAANDYVRFTDLEVITAWDEYEVPGEFLSWAGEQGIAALDVELDSIEPPWQAHLSEHVSGVGQVIQGFIQGYGP
ncbi:M14 family metallopeptidase [Spirochaeta lutea]|uniref:Peptidase M14 domain-containing protein n=1 Tax=Spirochaeta lutea TaxID=1480694 RepID=A0A098QTK6_9SPIO|nr:M14 family metallopeptidase [Spirochaeta lutea]KGE71210.1 hypothetical protein DC28_12195 [Spirochaeta lutea]